MSMKTPRRRRQKHSNDVIIMCQTSTLNLKPKELSICTTRETESVWDTIQNTQDWNDFSTSFSNQSWQESNHRGRHSSYMFLFFSIYFSLMVLLNRWCRIKTPQYKADKVTYSCSFDPLTYKTYKISVTLKYFIVHYQNHKPVLSFDTRITSNIYIYVVFDSNNITCMGEKVVRHYINIGRIKDNIAGINDVSHYSV